MIRSFQRKRRGLRKFDSLSRRLVLVILVAALMGAAGRGSGTQSLMSAVMQPIQKLVHAFNIVKEAPSRLTSQIDPERELVIRALAVVNDARAQGNGPWSVGSLIANMAPAEIDPADFAEDWMRLWIDTCAANPHDFITAPAGDPSSPDPDAAKQRAAALEQFLSNWPRGADGKLDLSKAPFRLLAITNRLDLGEGRFSFSGIVADTSVYPDRSLGEVLDLSVIFEYELPAQGADGTVQDPAWWANQWHSLAQYPLTSEDYRNALQNLTDKFAARNAAPDRINGSALKHLRVNEQVADAGFGFDVTPVWQCLGFLLSSSAHGFMEVEQLADTPHYDYDAFTCDAVESDLCQQTLIDYLIANQTAILNGSWHLDPAGEIVPAKYGPEAITTFSWLENSPTPDGISADQWSSVRVAFSNMTCSGCHSSGRGYPSRKLIQPHEFMHVSERDAEEESSLSPFLTQQIEDVRIPNMLSYLSPQDSRARRVDPSRRPVH